MSQNLFQKSLKDNRFRENDIISSNLSKRLGTAKKRAANLSEEETKLVAGNLDRLINGLDINKFILCKKVFGAEKEDSTKRLYKFTLPPESSAKRLHSLVRKTSIYRDIAKAIAKIRGEEGSYYYSDIFQGTTLASKHITTNEDENSDGEVIDQLFYEVSSMLHKMSEAVITSEGLEEYYRILSKGTYNYRNIFPQYQPSNSICLILNGTFDNTGTPQYPLSEEWKYSHLVPTLNIHLENAADCIGLISAPLLTLMNKETLLRLELIPVSPIGTEAAACPVVINDVRVQEKVELWLVVQSASAIAGEYEQARYNTLIQMRCGVHFNHPDIQGLFTYDEECALVAFKGNIYRIQWPDTIVRRNSSFIPEYIDPESIKELLDITEFELLHNPHPSYKLDYCPLRCTREAPGLLQQPFSSPYYGNTTNQITQHTFAEKLYANLLADQSEAASIEGYLRRDARRKKALLMQGHKAYQEQLEKGLHVTNMRWEDNIAAEES